MQTAFVQMKPFLHLKKTSLLREQDTYIIKLM